MKAGQTTGSTPADERLRRPAERFLPKREKCAGKDFRGPELSAAPGHLVVRP